MTRFRNALLADGRHVDLRVRDGVVTQVESHIDPMFGEDDIDVAGRLLLGAPAEPHAHLDKALLADRVENPDGDLMGAIVAMMAHRPNLTVDDIAERAERAARMMLVNGCTAIRTHVDVGDDIGTMAVEALLRVRGAMADVLDLQIVALLAAPTTGLAGAGNRAAMRDAFQVGADVVGGCPHLDPEPERCQRYFLETGGELGLPVDLHTDEHLDPAHCDLAVMAEWVTRTGFRNGVTASHCVSLGMRDGSEQERIARDVADARIAVITLPHTNLFLQGRAHSVATPRGLTAIRPLLRAGVVLAAGADNLQDPFNTLGRADPFETAALMVMAGHLTPTEAWQSVSTASRQAMGLAPAGPAVGLVADFVAVPAATLREAIAMGPAGRMVVRRGVVVAGG